MNTEQIILLFQNNTRVDIQGDPFVLKQIIERLDGLVITFEHKTIFGFGTQSEEKTK